MSKSLVELTKDYLALLEKVYEYEAGGYDIPAELELALGEMLTTQAEKVDNCASFVGWMSAQKDWLKEEKKRIDAQIKKYEYMEGRIKRAAEHVMLLEGSTKIEGLKGHSFSKRKSTSCEIIDAGLVPEGFKSWEPKINKAEILKELRNGADIPGAALKTSESIVVK